MMIGDYVVCMGSGIAAMRGSFVAIVFYLFYKVFVERLWRYHATPSLYWRVDPAPCDRSGGPET